MIHDQTDMAITSDLFLQVDEIVGKDTIISLDLQVNLHHLYHALHEPNAVFDMGIFK